MTTEVSKIQDHMDVMDADGNMIGKVDHLEGEDKIKLTKSSSPDGLHHYVPVTWIDHVDSCVHLKKAITDVTALQKAS